MRELRNRIADRGPCPADENAIRNQLTALREHDDRAAAELRQAYDALDEVLDTRQQARFRVFEETIERRKLDLLVRARARAARRQQRQATASVRRSPSVTAYRVRRCYGSRRSVWRSSPAGLIALAVPSAAQRR